MTERKLSFKVCLKQCQREIQHTKLGSFTFRYEFKDPVKPVLINTELTALIQVSHDQSTNKLVDLYWLGKYFEHMQEHRKSSRDDKYKHQRSFLLEIPPEFLQVYSAGTVICLRDVFRGLNVVLPILHDLNGYINKNNCIC